MRELSQVGYTVETGPSAADDGRFAVTGWTTKIQVDGATVVQWAREMCQVGYERDCDFDGWGTTPVQE